MLQLCPGYDPVMTQVCTGYDPLMPGYESLKLCHHMVAYIVVEQTNKQTDIDTHIPISMYIYFYNMYCISNLELIRFAVQSNLGLRTVKMRANLAFLTLDLRLSRSKQL